MVVKQRIIQLYFQRKISFGQILRILQREGFNILRQTIWLIVRKYQKHGTLSRLPGSGRRFKLSNEVLAIIEAQMRDNDEKTATQLIKLLNDKGFNISKLTIIQARKLLKWIFHGSSYCQMIRAKNKEKRVKWATDNQANNFENIIWTDESVIQLENHRINF